MSNLDELLMAVGILAIIVVLCFIIVMIFYAMKEAISVARIKYMQKHRFDKPPTAKCYCKDCKRWYIRDGNGYCDKFSGWCTADCWFCWDAEPRTK